METTDKVLSNLGTILRYLASGFVAILVTIWVDKCVDPLKLAGDSGYPSWAVPVGAGLVGIFVYALHTGFLVRPFWALVVRSHKCPPLKGWSKLEKPFPQKTWAMQKTWAIMWYLDTQRWKRRASNDAEVKAVQKELDKWSELLNFLYCSAYITIVTPILVKYFHTGQAEEYWWKVSCFAGCLIMVFALISDWRETNREFWACYEYPDGILKSAAQTQTLLTQ